MLFILNITDAYAVPPRMPPSFSPNLSNEAINFKIGENNLNVPRKYFVYEPPYHTNYYIEYYVTIPDVRPVAKAFQKFKETYSHLVMDDYIPRPEKVKFYKPFSEEERTRLLLEQESREREWHEKVEQGMQMPPPLTLSTIPKGHVVSMFGDQILYISVMSKIALQRQCEEEINRPEYLRGFNYSNCFPDVPEGTLKEEIPVNGDVFIRYFLPEEWADQKHNIRKKVKALTDSFVVQ